jgi:hypothetical protein
MPAAASVLVSISWRTSASNCAEWQHQVGADLTSFSRGELLQGLAISV